MNRKWGCFTVLLFMSLLLCCYAKGMGGNIPASQNKTAPEQAEEESKEEEIEAGGEKDKKRAAITFDDGPSPRCTAVLLDGLKERGVKATFFVIGKSAGEYPDLVKRMIEEGHIVGNHTYSHIQLSACSYEKAADEIQKANQALFEITGKVPVYIRPPFGSYTKKLESQIPMEVVLWTIDPVDWKVQNTQTVVRHVLSNIKDGSIILLHDPYPTSVEAAFQIIDKLQAEGWEFVTVDELAGQYDIH